MSSNLLVLTLINLNNNAIFVAGDALVRVVATLNCVLDGIPLISYIPSVPLFNPTTVIISPTLRLWNKSVVKVKVSDGESTTEAITFGICLVYLNTSQLPLDVKPTQTILPSFNALTLLTSSNDALL